ncbi:MAG: CHAT domain-containing protein, partial [Xanthomarina sp.]
EAETTNYLIKTHTISYAYSMSYLKDNKKLNRQAKNNFLGFAPHSFNYDNLQSLPRSQSEIKTIETLITGESFMNLDATKSNFLNTINNYKIIHLSTHANANDSIAPWIAFKDDKLYLNELYTFKNQAELVVLNACKSSLGEINSGEGVFSLARGFFYSGANSVISSLWNVNDKSNQEITISFYKYLKKGKTKSAALRLAKLDYLEKHSLSEASPYYWSSLILIGDDSSMKVANYNWLQMLIISLLILISIIFIKKHKNRG